MPKPMTIRGGTVWLQAGPLAARVLIFFFLLAAVVDSKAHDNVITPTVEQLMGLPDGEHATVCPRPEAPHSGFFLAQTYDPKLAIPADVVQLYSGLENTAGAVGLGKVETPTAHSWVEHGYETELFLHSRYGGDQTPASADQTNKNGRPLSVIGIYMGDKQVDLAIGAITPDLVAAMRMKHGREAVVRQIDRYMIPTTGRIALAREYYNAVRSLDVRGFAFDEPEIWVTAGYSEAFKAEWKNFYGTDWQPPHSSVDARYRSERLKAHLLQRWIGGIFEGVHQLRPDASLSLALHSQVNYASMGMCAPHHQLASLPLLHRIIAEVWNEPFDQTYLQFSSFHHLTRSTGKELWLMMDPWGDSPSMSLDYYRRSYGNNVLGALMFPEEDHYMPLIWPNRLYGKIPRAYETLINSVTGALVDLWRYPGGSVDGGTRGLGTFVSDTMSMQRAGPAPSDFDGVAGIAAPIVQHGVPIDVLSLDRAAEPGYLADSRCLLLSYDFLKPETAADNHALAEWVTQGGSLVCFGGTDAYNAVQDSWWVKAGFKSPLEALLSELGLPPTIPRAVDHATAPVHLLPTAAFDRGLPPLDFTLGPTPGEDQLQRRMKYWQSEESTKRQPGTYPLTLFAPPSGATPLVQMEDGSSAVGWECRVGRGTIIVLGISPGVFSALDAGPLWIRALARHGMERAGVSYREETRFVIHRGPYTGVRTLDSPFTLRGSYVDLFSPDLAVVKNPVIPPQTNALYWNCPAANGDGDAPCVSGRLRAFVEKPLVSAFVVQAPAQTEGVARVLRHSRQVRSVSAFTTTGAGVAVNNTVELDTLKLTYHNEADGVVLRVDWAPENQEPQSRP